MLVWRRRTRRCITSGAGAARSEGGGTFKLLGTPPRGDGSSQGGVGPPLEVMVHVPGTPLGVLMVVWLRLLHQNAKRLV